MATKKATAETAEENVNVLDETEKSILESTNTMVDIKLPRGGEKDDPMVIIGVNGKNWSIPKGKTVKVPKFVAYEIERSEAAKQHYYEVVDDMVDKSKF